MYVFYHTLMCRERLRFKVRRWTLVGSTLINVVSLVVYDVLSQTKGIKGGCLVQQVVNGRMVVCGGVYLWSLYHCRKCSFKTKVYFVDAKFQSFEKSRWCTWGSIVSVNYLDMLLLICGIYCIGTFEGPNGKSGNSGSLGTTVRLIPSVLFT